MHYLLHFRTPLTRILPSQTSEGGSQMDVETQFKPWQHTVDSRGKRWRAAFAAALGVVAFTAGLVGCTKGKIPETETESRQVLLEAANSAGESPWMGSVATATVTDDLPAELQAELSSAQPAPSSGQVATADAPIAVSGDKVGLYGGSTGVAVCDREKMVTFLERNPVQGDAWRQATGARDIRKYANTLSPVLLTNDTRVTNNSLKNGKPVPFQSVLQAGTGVMVDDRGVPKVRCACGNPLSEPQSSVQKSTYTGQRWETFSERKVVAVQEAVEPMAVIELAAPPVNGETTVPSQGAQIVPGEEVATESELPNPLTTEATEGLETDSSTSEEATTTETEPVIEDTTTTEPTTTSEEPTDVLEPDTPTEGAGPAVDEWPSEEPEIELYPPDVGAGTAVTETTLPPISEP